MVHFIAGVAAMLCTLFAGAAIHISLSEHAGNRRAVMMQRTLAISAGVTAVMTWFHGEGTWWLWGGLIILAAVPVTQHAVRSLLGLAASVVLLYALAQI